jgi:membrane associated rhomboid family serine protease
MRLSGRKSSFARQRWTQRQRVVLLTLIGANLAVFFGQILLEAYQPGFIHDYLALSKQGIRDAYAWQFVTAMFLHNGAWHLVGNLLLLYFLGRDVESILGQRHFLYLYLAGTIGGELGHLFLMPPDSFLFAASGGVAAVLVAYATILPELELTAVTFFAVPLRLKAKHLAYAAIVVGLVLICIDRTGSVSHSACLGGCAAGWLYAHLLGFGQPSFLQRALRQRRAAAERLSQMTLGQFITEEIDPLLDKISRTGIGSLTRAERRTLAKVRDKVGEKPQTR